jgi:hypothetical protein
MTNQPFKRHSLCEEHGQEHPLPEKGFRKKVADATAILHINATQYDDSLPLG